MTHDLTIREMCDAFDVTPRTLRFYEQKELLFPQRQGQRRLYGRRDRARLTLILRGRRFGIPLEEIRQLLDIYDRAGALAQVERTLAVAAGRLAQLEAERDAIETTIAALKEQMAWGRELLEAHREAAA